MDKGTLKFVKILLAGVALIALAVGLYWLVGLIASILWGALWIGLLGAVGYGGYKLLMGRDSANAELGEKRPVEMADMKDTDKALEEYKRRLLPK